MANLPRISIITIVYNGVLEIETTIQSVLNQAYSNLEYIIIDGASTDGTQMVVDRFNSSIAYFESSPDEGISDAFNKGIAHATGDLIGLINAGDILAPNALQHIANNYLTIENADKMLVLHGNIQMGINSGKVYRPFRLESFIYHMAIWHPTIFVTAQVYQQFKYRKNFKIAMDYDLFSRVYASDAMFKHIDETIVCMDTNGLSNSHAIQGFKEVRLASRENLKISFMMSQIFYTYRCVLFYLIKIKACLV